jgi:hypothetical protein
MPSGSNMIKMLNISSIFKNYKYVDEYYDSVFLTGLTLVSARKYVQSVEFFRTIQKHIFNILHGIPDDFYQHEEKKTVDVKSKEISDNFSPDSDSKITKLTLKKLIHKAAKLEILIADCCSQHSQLYTCAYDNQLQEKLDAFKKAAVLYRIKSLKEFKEQVPLYSYNSLNRSSKETKMGQYIQEEDIYTELLKLQPDLLDWILLNLNEKVELIRIAFLKSLEFLLDTLG